MKPFPVLAATRVAAASLFCVIAAVNALAQSVTMENPPSTMPPRGFYPGGSYSLSEIESVDNVTGNVILKIPVAKLPPGRAGSGFGLDLVYNSTIWDLWTSFNSIVTTGSFGAGGEVPSGTVYWNEEFIPSVTGAWQYGLNYELRWDQKPSNQACVNNELMIVNGSPSDNSQYFNYLPYIILPDGSRHSLRMEAQPTDSNGYYKFSPYLDVPSSANSNCSATAPATPLVYSTFDGSYIRVVVTPPTTQIAPPGTSSGSGSWIMYLPDGTQVSGSGPESPPSTGGTGNGVVHYLAGSVTAVTDRNGNTIHFNGFCPDTAPCTETITDDLGRAITVNTGTGNQDVITWPGPPNSPTLTAYVNWVGGVVTNGVTYNCVFSGAGAFAPTTVPGGNTCPLYSPAVVGSIQLPTNTTGAPSTSGASQWQYTFGYSTPSTACNDGGTPTSWGELHSVTVPSGAQAQYTYRWDCQTGRTAEIMPNPLVTRQHIYNEIRDNVTTPITETTTYYGYVATEGGGGPIVQTNPDGTQTKSCLVALINNIPPDHVYKEVNPDGSVTERLWLLNQNPVVNFNPNVLGAGAAPNPYIAAEATTVVSSSGALTATSARAYAIDKNGNNLETDEYDWYSPTTSNQCTGMITGIPGTPKRSTVNTWYAATYAASAGYMDTTNGYWNSAAPSNLRAKQLTTVCNGPATGGVCTSAAAATSYTYDSWQTTANLIQELRWDSKLGSYGGSGAVPAGVADTTIRTYDKWGNLLTTTDPQTTTDPNSFVTETIYDTTNNLFPTDRYVAFGQPEQRHTTFVYDFNSGLLSSKTDADNNVKTAYTYDDIGRETLEEETDAADSVDRKTQTSYDDLDLIETVKRDQKTTGDGILTTTTYYDPLGRVRLVDNGVSRVQKAYRYGNGVNYELDSNPYLNTEASSDNSEATMGWTLTTRDSLNRVTSVAHYSGGTPPGPLTTPPTSLTPPNTNLTPYPWPAFQSPSPWCSSGCGTGTGTVTTAYSATTSGSTGISATTTVTDEAGNAHVNTVDGLGRLTSVTEANSNTTLYTYDLLNNLTGVSMPNQGATQSRSFTYSSMSRLLTATNPESNTVSYGYDARGNLIQRTDANGTIMCVGDAPSSGVCPGTSSAASGALAYDGLGRPRAKNYSVAPPAASTSAIAYVYDQDTKGTLYSVTSGGNSTVYTHDKLGRVLGSTQSTAGAAVPPFAYSYSLSDQLLKIGYPSGRSVQYGFDSADRILNVTGALLGQQPTNYTVANQNITYTAAGGFSSLPLGNGVTQSYGWNDRFQQVSVTAGNLLGLNFYPCANGQTACSNNNGNIWQETISVNGTVQATQEFQYDALNRLTLAEERQTASSFTPAPGCADTNAVWCEPYNYDAVGNRTVGSQATTGSLAWEVSGVSPATNRITDAGWTYDLAGNITATPLTASITYDAENRQVQFCGTGTSCDQYVYDGTGHRVQKITSSGTVTYVYDATGKLAAEYGATSADGTQPATGTQYLTTDHLGSTRLVTDANGSPAVERHDYLPFGYELSSAWRTSPLGYAPETVRQKFTGKERDAETGLDYFGARYFSGAQGRFTSPDWSATPQPVPYANLRDPQTLNLYAYVRNNPLSIRDFDGHGWWGDLWKGIADHTYRPLVQFVSHPIVTARNFGSVITHPVATARAMKTGVVTTTIKVFHGNGEAIGTAIGTVGMAFIPGAGEAGEGAEAVEAAADLGKAAEVGEAAAVAEDAATAVVESTGRTEAANLTEQIAMEQAKSSPTAGSVVPLKNGMTDARWPGSQGWVKMRQNINGVEVHYVRNVNTGAVADFKFK